ncbi:hypothetical protein ACHAWO_001819 [Cyclotella atomus]|uniref:Uncharacterized protein n=1 Tax=Cyclotella atomus TaxID=382360 RepID=A0ABD3MVS0_9STRA
MDMSLINNDGATPLLSDDQAETPPASNASRNSLTDVSDPEAHDQNEKVEDPYHVDAGVSSLTLAMIIFYNVTGGPFGIEPTVKAAGNLYAIIGVALFPFLWAIPEVYMTFRLSTLYPCASGGVLWCETAFGPSTGLMQGYLGWIGGVVNGATYPALLYEYIMSQFYSDKGESEVNPLIRYSFMMLMVLLMTLINYRGLDCVGKGATLMYIISMSAFLVMTILAIPKIDPQRWLQTPEPGTKEEQFDDDSLSTTGWLPMVNLGGIEFRVFINTLYWNFNNFDQAGHYSVSAPKKKFKRGLAIALFLCSTAYLIPILAATGATTIAQADWKAGTFAVAATEIGGNWLGSWVVVSSAISVISSFNAEIAADSMQLMGMSDRAKLPSVFSHRSPFGTPTYSIMLCLIVVASVLPLDFALIVEMTNFAYCVSVTLEFASFIKLQVIDGGHSIVRRITYAIMMAPALIINILVMLLASYATYIYAAVVIMIGFALINAKPMNKFAKRCLTSRKEQGETNSVGTVDKSVA